MLFLFNLLYISSSVVSIILRSHKLLNSSNHHCCLRVNASSLPIINEDLRDRRRRRTIETLLAQPDRIGKPHEEQLQGVHRARDADCKEVPASPIAIESRREPNHSGGPQQKRVSGIPYALSKLAWLLLCEARDDHAQNGKRCGV